MAVPLSMTAPKETQHQAPNKGLLLVKIALVGETGTGKSSLCARLQHPDAGDPPEAAPTLGVDFKLANIDGARVHIWDTSGDPKYRQISQCYYRQAHAVCICYDSGREQTLDEVPAWLQRVREHATPSAIAICATKSDVMASEGIHDRARALADSFGVVWLEASALKGTGVRDVFRRLIADVQLSSSRLELLGASGGPPSISPVQAQPPTLQIPTPAAANNAAMTFACSPVLMRVCSKCPWSHAEHRANEKERERTRADALSALQVFDVEDNQTPDENSIPIAPVTTCTRSRPVYCANDRSNAAAPSCAQQLRL